MGKLFVLICALLSGVFAFAQAVPPETVEQWAGYLPKFVEAMLAGNLQVLAGISIMLLMVVIRQFVLPKAKINGDHLPFITAAVSGISFGALSMLSSVPFSTAMLNGLVTALLAGGTWDLLGKYLTKLLLGDKFAEPVPKPGSGKTGLS